MKRRQILAIFTALAVSLSSAALLSGCAGQTRYYKEFAYDENGKPVPVLDTEVSLVSTTDDSSTASAGSSEESTAADSSSTAEESSAAPAGSSAEPSSEAPAESSAEPSSEAPAAAGVVIKFTVPTDKAKWTGQTDIYAYVVGDLDVKNADWPGVAMTDEGNGTFSYTVPDNIPNPLVTFNCNGGTVQYPRSKGLPVENGKTYTVE